MKSGKEADLQATMDWEAQDDGFLAKIIMAEGSKDVSVGTPVAVVVEEEDDVGFSNKSIVIDSHSAACRMKGKQKNLQGLVQSKIVSLKTSFKV